MSEYNRINDRTFESLQNYYKNRDLQKTFGISDENMAYKRFGENTGVDPYSLNEEQKATAISSFKKENAELYAGSNPYSQFLFANNLIDEETSDIVNDIEEENRTFLEKTLGGIGDEILELIPGLHLLANDKKALIDVQSTIDSARESGVGFLEIVNIATEMIVGYQSNAMLSFNNYGDNIVKGLERGFVRVADMIGSSLVELNDQRFDSQNIREDIINNSEYAELFTEINELRSLTNKTEEQRARLKELENTTINVQNTSGLMSFVSGIGEKVLELTTGEDLSNNSNMQNVKAKSILNKYNSFSTAGPFAASTQGLAVIGETLRGISNAMIKTEAMNNEYSKAIASGEIEMKGQWKDLRFWTNQIPESVGQIGGVVALTALTPGVPDEFAAAGYVIDGIPINMMFSAVESNQVREDAKAAGYSDTEIAAMTDKTFMLNVAVQGALGAAPGAVSKLAAKSSKFAAFAATSTSKRYIALATTTSIDALFEGTEEILQDEIRNAQLDPDYKFMAEASFETFLLGFAGGLFGGGTVFMNSSAMERTYNNFLSNKNYSPALVSKYKESVASGKTDLEAKDEAISYVLELVEGTPLAEEAAETERKDMIGATIEEIVKPAKDIQSQQKNIIETRDAKINLETRNSKIDGTNFKYDESDGNVRIIEGIDKQSKYTDKYALTDIIMQEIYEKHDVQYDEKTNTYTKKGSMTAFSKETNMLLKTYEQAHKMIVDLSSKVKVSDAKKYINKHGITNQKINSMYEAGALTSSQYIQAVRELGVIPKEEQLMKNIKIADDIEDGVNDIDNLDMKEFKRIAEQLKSDFGTAGKGLTALVEMGALDAKDAAVFKNHQKTLIKIRDDKAKDDTKKELENVTKERDNIVEETAKKDVKQKEVTKKLKDENKELKKQIKKDTLPQKVAKESELKADTTIGLNAEQTKIDLIRNPDKVEKTESDLMNEKVAQMQEKIRMEELAALQAKKETEAAATEIIETSKETKVGDETVTKNESKLEKAVRLLFKTDAEIQNAIDILEADTLDRVNKNKTNSLLEFFKAQDNRNAEVFIKNMKALGVEAHADTLNNLWLTMKTYNVEAKDMISILEKKAKKIGKNIKETKSEKAVKLPKKTTKIMDKYDAHVFSDTNLPLAYYSDGIRTTAFASIGMNGKNVIFQLNSKGKWMPTLGLNPQANARIITITSNAAASYFNNSELKKIGENLDKEYGDIRKKIEKFMEDEGLDFVTPLPSDINSIMENYEESSDKKFDKEVKAKNMIVVQEFINELKQKTKVEKTKETPIVTVGRKSKQQTYAANVQTSLLAKIMDVDRAEQYANYNDEKGKERMINLAEDIAKNGFKDRLHIDYNPETGETVLGEGNHRLQIALELGLADIPVDVVIGRGRNIAKESLKLPAGLIEGGYGSPHNSGPQFDAFIKALELTTNNTILKPSTKAEVKAKYDKQINAIIEDNYNEITREIDDSIEMAEYKKRRDDKSFRTDYSNYDEYIDETSNRGYEKKYELRTDQKGQFWLHDDNSTVWKVEKNENGGYIYLPVFGDENKMGKDPHIYAKKLFEKYSDEFIDDQTFQENAMNNIIADSLFEEETDYYGDQIKEFNKMKDNLDYTEDSVIETMEKYNEWYESEYGSKKSDLHIKDMKKSIEDKNKMAEQQMEYVNEDKDAYNKLIEDIRQYRVEDKKTTVRKVRKNPVQVVFERNNINPKNIMHGLEVVTENGSFEDSIHLYDKKSEQSKSIKNSEKYLYDLSEAKMLVVNKQEEFNRLQTIEKAKDEITSRIYDDAVYMFADEDATGTFKNYALIKTIHDDLVSRGITSEEQFYDVGLDIDYWDKQGKTYINKLKDEYYTEDYAPRDNPLDFEDVGLFDFVKDMEKIIELGNEFGFDRDVTIDAIKKDENLFTRQGFDGIDTRAIGDYAKAPSILFNEDYDKGIPFSEVMREVKLQEAANKKTEDIVRENCK